MPTPLASAHDQPTAVKFDHDYNHEAFIQHGYLLEELLKGFGGDMIGHTKAAFFCSVSFLGKMQQGQIWGIQIFDFRLFAQRNVKHIPGKLW